MFGSKFTRCLNGLVGAALIIPLQTASMVEENILEGLVVVNMLIYMMKKKIVFSL